MYMSSTHQHLRPPVSWSTKIIFLITTIDIDNDLTASNTAPTSVFAATNSAATPAHSRASAFAQLMLAHPLMVLPTWRTQRWCSLALLMLVPSLMAPSMMAQPTMAKSTMALPKMALSTIVLPARVSPTVEQSSIAPPKTALPTQLLLLQPKLHHKGTLIKRGIFLRNHKNKL